MTIVGLALAAAALVVAIVALVVSGAQLRIQRAEHEAFLDQINAHASLFAEMHLMEHDADVQRVDQGTVYRVLAIGMRNVGQRAAEQVSVNVLAPVEIEMTWCGPRSRPVAWCKTGSDGPGL